MKQSEVIKATVKFVPVAVEAERQIWKAIDSFIEAVVSEHIANLRQNVSVKQFEADS